MGRWDGKFSFFSDFYDNCNRIVPSLALRAVWRMTISSTSTKEPAVLAGSRPIEWGWVLPSLLILLLVGCDGIGRNQASRERPTKISYYGSGSIAQSKGLTIAGVKPGDDWEDLSSRISRRASITLKRPFNYTIVTGTDSFEVRTVEDNSGRERVSVVWGDSRVHLMMDGALILPLKERKFLSEVVTDGLTKVRDDEVVAEYTDGRNTLTLQFSGAKRVGAVSLSANP